MPVYSYSPEVAFTSVRGTLTGLLHWVVPAKRLYTRKLCSLFLKAP